MRIHLTATYLKTATNGQYMSMFETFAAPSHSSSMESTDNSSLTWGTSTNGFSTLVSSSHLAKAHLPTHTTWHCAQFTISSATNCSPF